MRAVVGKASYTDPRATDYVTRVLMQRREKVLRDVAERVNAARRPVVDGRPADGRQRGVAAASRRRRALHRAVVHARQRRRGTTADSRVEWP